VEDEMDASLDVIDVLGWVAMGVIIVALSWTANYRGRIHCLLRKRIPDGLVNAARELWRARLALVVALEA
jgi:hypothetical protein